MASSWPSFPQPWPIWGKSKRIFHQAKNLQEFWTSVSGKIFVGLKDPPIAHVRNAGRSLNTSAAVTVCHVNSPDVTRHFASSASVCLVVETAIWHRFRSGMRKKVTVTIVTHLPKKKQHLQICQRIRSSLSGDCRRCYQCALRQPDPKQWTSQSILHWWWRRRLDFVFEFKWQCAIFPHQGNRFWLCLCYSSVC